MHMIVTVGFMRMHSFLPMTAAYMLKLTTPRVRCEYDRSTEQRPEPNS